MAYKPAALVTIDDRAITFDGTFPLVAELLAFKPWNKQPRTPNGALIGLYADNFDHASFKGMAEHMGGLCHKGREQP